MKMMILKMWVWVCQMMNIPKHWWIFGLKIIDSNSESDNELQLCHNDDGELKNFASCLELKFRLYSTASDIK